ncbi:helix-turn-helix transcriptional regulator [Cellulomonas sp. Sa3CUA2]|uniref:Helix-turn-helix transcriptional regulator n=1 Tax=Cellulomonas avistercoris TaxID=2762242 RepID=A0ABR8QG74_9CELL|nr:TetR/AcrR family transcriptional regulator [Cellulomonas avistercoris]MBD7919431.1 helix-turn-helix transcriptional regulator [Cellulomonas avistercoris]
MPDTAAPEAGAPPAGAATGGRAATRRALLEAAYVEFIEVGYLRTTIGAVCTRAGYTRGAFYSSFRSKEDLVAALYRSANALQVARVRRAVLGAVGRAAPGTHPGAAVSAALRDLSGQIGDEARWFGVVTELRGVAVRDERARAVLLDAQDDLYAGLQGIVEEVLRRTGTTTALAVRDVVVVAVGLYERAFASGAPDAPATATAVAVATDQLEAFLRAVTRD